MADASDRRPAPSATGTLSERPLAHVLLYARNKRLTGKFEVHAPDGRHGTIVFWRGRITDVKTVPPLHYLGAIVYELGLIDSATLDATLMELAKKQKKHGEILVERGAITAAQRDDALHEQACRKIHHVFGFPPASAFGFYDARAGVTEPLLLVDPLAAAWRGIRELPPDASVKEVVTRFLVKPLRLVNEAPLDRAGFGAEEKAIVQALSERPLSVGDMRSMAKLPAARVDQLAFLLVAGKCAEAASESKPNLPAAAPSEPRIPIMPGGMRSFPTPFNGFHALKSPSSGSLPAAKPTPISGEVRARPPSFRVPSRPQMGAVKTHDSSPKLEAANMIPIAPSDLGPTGLAARAQTIEKEGYFEALGLPRGASEEAVRAAYFRLAKLWHPDRLPADLALYRDEAATVFAYLTHAHQVLTDAEQRKQYLATNAPLVETRPRAQVIREIDALLARHDWTNAEMEATALRDANPDDADAVAFVAWIGVKGGEASEDALRAAITQLDRAIYGDRYCDRAYWYRGVLHKRLKNDQAAHRDFVRVVQLDPKHVDAQREVRLHEMRQRKGSGEHLLTLFGKDKKG